jgi:hypothetical protein
MKTDPNEEEKILVCLQTANCPIPGVKSVIDQCTHCGMSVWRALSSPAGARVICERCFIEETEKAAAAGEPLILEPPTPDQLREIRSKTNGEI